MSEKTFDVLFLIVAIFILVVIITSPGPKERRDWKEYCLNNGYDKVTFEIKLPEWQVWCKSYAGQIGEYP